MRLATATRERPARISPEQIAAALHAASIAEIGERGGLVWDLKKTRPAAGDYWACCPFHAEKTASLHVVERGAQSFFNCFGCGAKGDPIELARRLHGVTFREAFRIVGGDASATPDPELVAAREQRRREMEAEAKRKRTQNRAAAVEIWEGGEPIAGTLAARYLRVCRRIAGYLGAADLRFHPAAPLSPYDHAKAGKRPAMLARIVNADGEHIGTHLTFLRCDGSDKLPLAHLGGGSRIICGDHVGGFIQLGRVRDAAVIGEGIETTASASDACGLPGLAAINAANLAAVILPERIKRVVIAHDRDPKGAGQLAGGALAERLWTEGRSPELFAPPIKFKDWNDAARAGAISKAEART